MNIYISKDIYNYINLIPEILYLNQNKITKSPYISYFDYLMDGLHKEAGCHNYLYQLMVHKKSYNTEISCFFNLNQISNYLWSMEMNDIQFNKIILIRHIDRFFENISESILVKESPLFIPIHQ